MSTASLTQTPVLSPADRAAHAAASFVRPAAPVTAFRIMRETEIAPHWWAKPVEIGETGSIFVADRFCAEQNNVTMNPNRARPHRYFVEPVYAEPTPAATS